MHTTDACLLYGGVTSGLMGELAGALIKLSGPDSVRGVTSRDILSRAGPEASNRMDTTADGLPESHVHLPPFDYIYARKKLVINMIASHPSKAGGFNALSECWSTVDEIGAAVQCHQLGTHQKEIVLLNIDGHRDKFIGWTKDATECGFVKKSSQEFV